MYNYAYNYAQSFVSMDLNIQDPGNIAVFLYTPEVVVSLRLRTTTLSLGEVSYVPVIFSSAHFVVENELQFTAVRPYESAVLAVVLLEKPTFVECNLFSSFTTTESYPTALVLNGFTPVVSFSTVDLQRSNTESWFITKQ